ncbi:uncharacterized protein [Haliotis cracherodii]|uniref:uncharacterized protein n=1 Tax=Haliotis cracherodii TaxID=6455 RepID=UPI0039ED3E27
MEGLYYVTGFLLILLKGALGETCSSEFSTDIECYNGCCGSYYTGQYCCSGYSSSFDYTYVNIPLIVGLSVGGLIFIVIVIAAICACVASANRPRRVIGVQPVGPMMVSTTAASSQQGGYRGQIPQPPAYAAYPPPGPPSAVHPPPAPPQNCVPPSATHP